MSHLIYLNFCIGDLNDMLYSSNKKGRHEHPDLLYKVFRDVVMDCGLVALPLEDYPLILEKGTWF